MDKAQKYRTALILTIIFGAIIIFLLWVSCKNLTNSLTYYQDNYQFVPKGSVGFYCDSGQEYACFDKGSYALIYNTQTENAVKCNSLKNEQATCSGENNQVSYCRKDQIIICADKTDRYITCGDGFQADCLDKSKYMTWDGRFTSTCPLNQQATCMDYDRFKIVAK